MIGNDRVGLSAEFAYRERNFAKYVAGIILLGNYTFLFGNAAFGCANKQLCGTNDANDRKDAERNGQKSSAVVIVKAKWRIKGRQNRFGKIVLAAATATGALLRVFHDLGSEDHGLYNLNHSGGDVFLSTVGLGTRAEIVTGVALEYADVAFVAVKDDTLFEHGNALKLLYSSAADARLDANLDVKTNGNRIKSAVELNGIDANKRRYDLCTLGTDRTRMLQNLVAEI